MGKCVINKATTLIKTEELHPSPFLQVAQRQTEAQEYSICLEDDGWHFKNCALSLTFHL